jgi:outer membrane receptor protein involved in Fe transport
MRRRRSSPSRLDSKNHLRESILVKLPCSIPDWTRFDIGARYPIARPGDKPIVLRAAIENLFNENYWASTNGARLTIGAPRTYPLSTTFQFQGSAAESK